MSAVFCIVCGNEFRPADPEVVICPACGGPPEAPATKQPQGTILMDAPQATIPDEKARPQETVGVDAAGELRFCIICGREFYIAGLDADKCPSCGGPPETPAVSTRTFAAETDIPEEWQVGDTILNLYEVKHIFTTGSMGLVYRVHHRQWNLDLAVKSPRAALFQNEAQKEAFIGEAEAWIDLGLHPHIVTCFYVRTLGGIPRIFAEFVEGGSLKDWIRDRCLYAGGEREALRRILDVAIQFAWGLGYAHEKGLVHQDVKPANALLTPDGTLKVTDFGLVKTKGYSLPYAAPEQILGREVDARTDIWCWGVSVLEMFTGEVTWAEGSIAAAALEGYLAEPPAGLPRMPQGVAELLRECFQDDPARRPPNMDAVVERLMAVYEREFGETYGRKKPKEPDLRADSLNNRAVSYLDLGREEEAVRCWQEALKVAPNHLASNLNLIYYKWTNGLIGVEEACATLETLIHTYERDANFWFYKFLIELEILGAAGFYDRPVESAVRALLCGSKEELLMERATQLLEKEIQRWSHPGCGGVYETGKVIFETLVREKLQSVIEVREMKGVTSILPIAGGKFVVGDTNGFVKIWNPIALGYEREWRVSTKAIRSLSTNNHNLVLADCDDKVVLLDTESDDWLEMEHHPSERFFHLCSGGKCALSVEAKKDLIGHDFGVTEVTLSQTVKLWNISDRSLVASVEIGGNESLLACSSDGQHFISSDSLNRLFLRNIYSTEKLALEFSYPISSLGFVAPDVISGCSYFPPYLYLISWHIRNHTLERSVRTLMGPGSPLYSALDKTGKYPSDCKPLYSAFDKTCKYLLVAWRSTIQIWDTAKGFLLSSYFNPSLGERIPGAPRYSYLNFAIDELNNLWVIYLQESKCIVTKIGRLILFSYILTPPLKYEVAYQEERKFQEVAIRSKTLWAEQRNEEAYRTLREFASCYPARASSPEFLDLLYNICSQKGRRKTLRDYYLRKQVYAHLDRVSALDFGPNDLFCSGSWDKTIKIWSVNELKLIRTLVGHTSGVNVVLFSRDGKYILSGSDDTTIRLWNVSTGECTLVFEGHSQGVSCIAFSPNMRLIASGSWDGTVKVWDIATGQCISTLEKVHTMKVSDIRFISDDTLFSSDALRVSWNIKTGSWETHRGSPTLSIQVEKVINVGGKTILPPHKREVTSFALSLEERWLVTGSEDQTICLFELDWDYDFPDPADWDEGARPYLDIFLTLHTPYGPDGLSRVGAPQWTEEDFQNLLKELGYRGYGWLRPEGVRRELEKMTRERGG